MFWYILYILHLACSACRPAVSAVYLLENTVSLRSVDVILCFFVGLSISCTWIWSCRFLVGSSFFGLWSYGASIRANLIAFFNVSVISGGFGCQCDAPLQQLAGF